MSAAQEVITTSDTAAADKWCGLIRNRWQDTVTAILDVGRMLEQAKAEVPHGAWGWMFSDENRERLPFGGRTAERLRSISKHPTLSDATHASLLPPSWMTLYELSLVPEPVLAQAIESGAVRPDMDRKHAKQLRPATSASQNLAAHEVSREYCTVDDLALLDGQQFGTVYADPPWIYGNQGTRGATGDHYVGLTVDEICALPIAALGAERSHLHLWTTNAFLFEARRVMEAWGFEYKSCFVWVKPQIGMGNYWRVSHEFLLLGSRGSLPFADKSLRSWGEFRRGQHSAKPEQIRDLIHKGSPGPRLELFARRPVEGWTCWGNEIKREIFHECV